MVGWERKYIGFFLCGVADRRGREKVMRDYDTAITTRVKNEDLGIFVEMESRKFFFLSA